MGRLKLDITWEKTAVRVVFRDADNIDRTALANVLTKMMRKKGLLTNQESVSRPNVSLWIKKQKVPALYIPFLRRVNMPSVISHRKPYTRKVKPVYAQPVAVQKGGK